MLKNYRITKLDQHFAKAKKIEVNHCDLYLSSREFDSEELEQLFEGHRQTRLISFVWKDFFWGELPFDLIETGGEFDYIRTEVECEGPWIAAIVPDQKQRLFSRFVVDLLTKNGQNLGLECFGSLPSITENYRPDLIPPKSIFEAYCVWMTWAEEALDADWSDVDCDKGWGPEWNDLFGEFDSTEEPENDEDDEYEERELLPDEVRMMALKCHLASTYRDKSRRARKKR